MVESGTGLEFIKIGSQLIQNLAGAPSQSGGEAMATFISDYFGKHSNAPNADFMLSPYLYPGMILRAETIPALRVLGIQYISIEEGGVIYNYRIRISTTRSMSVLFTDGEPDTYSLDCQRPGAHHVDYNSPRPEIHQVVIRYL
jgi:hypothetical protein